MKHRRRTIIFALVSLLLLAGSFLAGAYIGFSEKPLSEQVPSILKDRAPIIGDKADLDTFWKAWALIEEKYPEADEVTDEEKVWGAISGLVGSLGDPYSVFMAPEEAKEFQETITGEFGGVGMEVGEKDNVLTVIAPLKGTPAYHAGVKAGDKIIQIDDSLTSSLSVDEAVSLIRGKEGTEVRLTILREGERDPREISITRSVISVPVIDTELREDGIFVIRLYSFSLSSPELFRGALREFVASGTDKLVLDVRGNPGGYLEAAIDMASWFLPAGKPIVIEDFGEGKKERVYRSRGYNVFGDGLDMVILADGGSASASEILAGALREHGVATLVGEQTYGKGSVQELIELPEGTSLKITVANWKTPNRISISEEGLTPDIVVARGTEEGVDPQMERAVSILLGR